MTSPHDIVYKPADRPIVEVYDDWTYYPGEVRAWFWRKRLVRQRQLHQEPWQHLPQDRPRQLRPRRPEARSARVVNLSVREKMALTLADTPFHYPGAREARAREELGWSPTVFASRVNRLLDDPRAEVWDAMLVRRLRRLRDRRAAARTTGFKSAS